MNKVTKSFALLLAVIFAADRTFAQDSLNVNDAQEIQYRAKRLVSKDLNLLMNFLSNSDLEEKDAAEAIRNSHSGESGHIFYDQKAEVDYDMNPAIQSSERSHGEDIDKYLKDFELLYQKSDSESVVFSDLSCSPVKKKDRLYVKVYFNSFYKNKVTGIEAPFVTTKRFAEIRAVKEAHKWALAIDRIAFFNPADTMNDTLNNIAIFQTAGPKRVFANPQDSAVAAAKTLSLDDELAQARERKIEEEEAQKENKVRALVAKGDEADKNNNPVAAMNYFLQAKEVNGTDRIVLHKIKEEKERIESATITADETYKNSIKKARLEGENRQYDLAISDYQEAIKARPEEGPKLNDTIRQLNARFSVISELEEKFNQGLYKDVISAYKKAIKEKGENSDFYLGIARCYDKQNEFKDALKNYSRAYDLDLTNLKALENRADLYARNNDLPKAIADYKSYLNFEKEYMKIYLELSRLHVLVNNMDEAIRDLDRGLTVNPKAAPLYYSKGLLLIQKNDYRNASDNFTTSIRIDSSQAEAFYYRGKCQLELQQVDHAAADFANARERKLGVRDMDNIHSFASQFYNHSSQSYTAGKTDSAVRDIDRAVAIDPNFPQYRFSRGEYYFTLKDYKEAVRSYDKAIELDGSFHDALYKRGLAYYNLAAYPQAIENYAAVLKLTPQDGMAQRGTADAYFAIHDYPNAAGFYETALKSANTAKVSPFDAGLLADIYNKKGKSYLEQGQYEKAQSDFKSAIRNNKNFSLAYFNLGETYYASNQLKDAIDNLGKAISLETVPPSLWAYTLAKAYQANKDFNNACSYYTTCINVDKDLAFPDAVYKQGYCYYVLQNFTAALPCYNRALSLRLDSAVSTFQLELGSVYLHTGKYDSAYSCYNTIYLKDSTNGFASYGLATSLLLEGKTDESLLWFDKSFQTHMVKYGDARKDKMLAKIVDDKRFQALKKKYN
jgi:tetratricopeptide (TPR) repeat protein